MPFRKLQSVASIAVATVIASATSKADSQSPLPWATPQEAGFSPAHLDRLHANLDARVDGGQYSGYIDMIVRDGKIVDWHAHGLLNVNNEVPLETDSIVRLYSMTKVVVSVGVLKLVEDGRLKLDEPVEKYLPALAKRKVFVGGTADELQLVDAERSITIRDLLTHTSGYYYDFTAPAPLVELSNRVDIWQGGNLDGFIERVAKLPLAHQPGEAFTYGISVDVLGAVVEKVTGETLAQYLLRTIFAPLSMSDTGFWLPEEKASRMAVIHARGESGELQLMPDLTFTMPGPDHGIYSGGAGLFSTMGDFARFAQMMLNGGELDGVRIVSRKTIELMTTDHIAHLAQPHPFGAPALGYGLGVRVVVDKGRSNTLESVGTYGWEGMATTLLNIDPKERMVTLLFFQHVPLNEDDVFSVFVNSAYGALAD